MFGFLVGEYAAGTVFSVFFDTKEKNDENSNRGLNKTTDFGMSQNYKYGHFLRNPSNCSGIYRTMENWIYTWF